MTPQLLFRADILLFALNNPVGKHESIGGMQSRMLTTIVELTGLARKPKTNKKTTRAAKVFRLKFRYFRVRARGLNGEELARSRLSHISSSVTES